MKSATELDKPARDLILGCEIAGLLHDLGKLRYEFAEEKMGDRKDRDNTIQETTGITEAHGAILEDQRVYPPPNEDPWLQDIKSHSGWARVLHLPQDWVKPGVIQASGLGAPLRQHHVQSKSQFGPENLSLIGDIYTMGADWRDSALDKGAGGAKSGNQRLDAGYIADSFGNERQPFGSQVLERLWPQAGEAIRATLLVPDAWEDVPRARKAFLSAIEEPCRQALGETRRPTNDVTLWHHVRSAASLFKAAMAELALREDGRHLQDDDGAMDMDRLGRIRFRLLGIRWDWAALTRMALRPVVLTALAQRRIETVAALRELLEVRHPIGNIIYEDDDGVVLAVPGFFEGVTPEHGQRADECFEGCIVGPLAGLILDALRPLGVGTTVRLAWSEPRLYLTDYAEVMDSSPQGNSPRERLLQIGEEELRGLWSQVAGRVRICTQCDLRPAQARELPMDNNLANQSLCDDCMDLSDESAQRKRWATAKDIFGIEPQTFDLDNIRQQRNANGNPRMVLLSVRIQAESIVDGSALLTQLARPLSDFNCDQLRSLTPVEAGELIHDTLKALEAGAGKKKLKRDGNTIRTLLGDRYWLTKSDGRAEGDLQDRARQVLDGFFLREAIPEDAGLYRHDGDKLFLFGQRKHPSPGRLARTWDDLRALWRDCLEEVAKTTDHWLMPLSLDARGFRVIVAADDAGACLGRIQKRVHDTLGRVRGSLPVHVSALAFRARFPLYLALDALRRMEGRGKATPPQHWTLRQRREAEGQLLLNWDTPQGKVEWTVPLTTGDPDRPDIWHPHAICVSRPQGPGRLAHLKDLAVGETIRRAPDTFDFMVLDSSVRRYQLRYDAQGRRPHFILGDPGRPPYLLEHLDPLLDLRRKTRWNPSQAKGLIGQLVDSYGAWVRDAHPSLREQGRAAWKIHAKALLLRYLPKDPELREFMLAHLDDGLVFDAFEWVGFIEKDRFSTVNSVSDHHKEFAP